LCFVNTLLDGCNYGAYSKNFASELVDFLGFKDAAIGVRQRLVNALSAIKVN